MIVRFSPRVPLMSLLHMSFPCLKFFNGISPQLRHSPNFKPGLQYRHNPFWWSLSYLDCCHKDCSNHMPSYYSLSLPGYFLPHFFIFLPLATLPQGIEPEQNCRVKVHAYLHISKIMRNYLPKGLSFFIPISTVQFHPFFKKSACEGLVMTDFLKRPIPLV